MSDAELVGAHAVTVDDVGCRFDHQRLSAAAAACAAADPSSSDPLSAWPACSRQTALSPVAVIAFSWIGGRRAVAGASPASCFAYVQALFGRQNLARCGQHASAKAVARSAVGQQRQPHERGRGAAVKRVSGSKVDQDVGRTADERTDQPATSTLSGWCCCTRPAAR